MENAEDIRKIIGPEDCGEQVSAGGVTYEADSDGVFTVPVDVALELRAHGFEQQKAEAKSRSKKAAQG